MSILTMMILLIGCSTNQIPPKIERTYPFTDQTYQVTTVENIIKEKPTEGNFNIDAYVVDVYFCPPCPKGALCKTCGSDFIIISDTPNYLENDNLRIDLDINTAKQFQEGKKYRFSIKYRLQKNAVYQTESEIIKLVGYDELLE
ncbi:hypothetical protein HYY69_07035 [Candidatus Woesearchaeota archaeon]|nr:hypothetical protein [Candidatus Woesearchaeota archaeon]